MSRILLTLLCAMLSLAAAPLAAPTSQPTTRSTEPRVTLKARVPSAPKLVYYEMDIYVHRWGAIPAGCLPYVNEGGGRYIDAEGNEDSWWVGGYYGPRRVADPAKLAAGLAQYPTGMLYVFNLEHFPTDVRFHGDAAVEDSTRTLRAILLAAKTARPDLRFGWYGNAPIRDYWFPTRYLTRPNALNLLGYERLQEANTRLTFGRFASGRPNASGGIVDALDVLNPSIYDFYAGDDQASIIAYTLAEGRRIGGGRQILAYLWHKYHDSNKTLARQPIPHDEWRMTCRQTLRGADGVVLWDTRDPAYVQIALEEAELAGR